MRISEQIQTARRERRVLARVCRAAWRLEQAGRERARAPASARAEGAPIRTPAGAWLVRTARFAAMNMPLDSGNRLLVFSCGCSVSGTHRNSAAEGGQLPGLPEERMPAGLVLSMAVLMARALPRSRLRPSVPDARRRARSLAWRLRMRRR